jgi:hypothetical protein
MAGRNRITSGGTATRQTRRAEDETRRAEDAAAAEAEQERQARITREADPRPTSSPLDVFGGGFLNPGKAAQEEYDAAEATKERYGGEFSWLDPTFQQQAELAKYDPAAIEQQSAAMGRARELSNENLNFSDPALQQALGGEWARIQGGQGAPQFGGDADQRRVLEQALGFSGNSGPGSLTFDDGSRQREQYGNLQGIIGGGGATAIEMADRARQRGDSEAWLRGQREADMADYAERGLTGSGMELLNLSADRQAAAQRNSLGDLETAKALEERRKSAINDAAGLATNMRGQTIDEQGLLNQRSMTGLSSAASVANSMRGADYDEKSYLDKRGLDALTARTDLQTKMRDQQYNEQIGNRDAKQSALNTWADTASDARKQGADESQYNTDVINKVKGDNVTYLREASETQKERSQERWREMLRLGVDASGKLIDVDQEDNIEGHKQGTGLAKDDADTKNDATGDYRDAVIKASDPTGALAADAAKNAYIGEAGKVGGAVIDTAATQGASQVDLGGKGGGAAAPAVASSTSALTQAQPRSSWRDRKRASAGAAYDPEQIRKAMGYS